MKMQTEATKQKIATVLTPTPDHDFDVSFGQFSTMWSFRALTPAAKEFVAEHVEVPDYMQVGAINDTSFMADHRMGRDLAFGLIDQGFVVFVNGRHATSHS